MTGEAGSGSEASAKRAQQSRRAKGAFAALAVVSLSIALLLTVLGRQFGIPDDISRTIATAFIGAAVIDAAVLYFWERLFGT